MVLTLNLCGQNSLFLLSGKILVYLTIVGIYGSNFLTRTHEIASEIRVVWEKNVMDYF